MGVGLSKLEDALHAAWTGRWAPLMRRAHQAGVIAGVGAVILATEPGLGPLALARCSLVAWVMAAAFALEYLARLWLAPRAHWAHRDEPWRARWHWATTFTGLVDLAGLLPLLALASGLGAARAQLFGALWVLKLVPYAPGLDLLGRVLRDTRRFLFGLLLGFLMVLGVAATLAYVVEGPAQPNAFGSIPRALWWGVTTLTTVGYGDAAPVTLLGRLLAAVVMLCGIGVCALWTAILVNGFGNEMRRSEFLRTWDLVAHVPFFQGLGAGTIAELAAVLKPSDAAAGATIVRRGEPGDCMYFIAAGEVMIELRPHPLHLGPGDFFGEMALITGEPRSATAAAVSDCKLLHLDVAEFHRIEAKHPELAAHIDHAAKRRLEEPAPAIREVGKV